MKKILLSFVLCFTVLSWASSQLESARYLGEQDIIVNQSAQAEQYYAHSISTTLEYQEARLYRLDDSLVRQEALGIIAKMANLYLPDSYRCRGYFTDTPEWWVCRAAEVSADNGIVSRNNTKFRPRDTLTFAEAFGLLVKALNIELSTKPTSSISIILPDWQKRLVLTAWEQDIGNFTNLYDKYHFSDKYRSFDFTMDKRMTRGEFFQLVAFFLTRNQETTPVCENFTFTNCPTSCDTVCIQCFNGICGNGCLDAPNSCQQKPFSFVGCKTYNDGCNDCVRGDAGVACTERACIWQGIPSCSECENGYVLENNRCVRKQNTCVTEGGYAGGGYVMYPENLNDYQCCSGLTRVEYDNRLPDAGYICIKQGDYICNGQYETSYNSSDCRLAVDSFDSSICQNYYDGCNSCSNTSDGNTVCTQRYCAVNGPAYCTTYKTYTPVTQTVDQQFTEKVLGDIRNYVKDLSCTSSSQCQWKLFGQNPCGSSSIGLQYSSKNIDMTLFESKTTYYTNMQKLFNQTYPVFGTCMVMTAPPALSCVNGMCQ